MKTYTGERLESLLETLAEFFPGGPVTLESNLGAKETGWRLVPSQSNPRLAVPASVPRAAMLSAIRPCASDGLKHKARRYALAALLRSPGAAKLMPAGITASESQGSIAEHLQSVFSQPVCFGVMTGSARANRKPVLGVFDLNGCELGFAKIGMSELTSELVANEHRALQAMNSTTNQQVQVPRVISYEQWQNQPVLVISALRPDAIQRPLPLPVEAVRTVISSAPVQTHQLGFSPWYTTIVQGLESLSEVPEARELIELLRQLNEQYPGPLAFGAWHGDFGAWNMARSSAAPMVWDWERYSEQMPLGLDLYHFSAHEQLRKVGNPQAAFQALSAGTTAGAVVSLHHLHGITSAARRLGSVVPLLYLATMAARFIEDGHRHHVDETFALGRWHIEVMHELLQNTYQG